MSRRYDIAIIADDFTGACDTGVQLARPGSPCPVTLWERTSYVSKISEKGARLRPVIVDTESRHCPEATAAARVRTAVRALALPPGAAGGSDQIPLIFKKVDSTLRGNIAAELMAIAETYVGHTFLVAPAFPAAGRTTVHGQCLVHGVPVDRTEFARDSRSPVATSVIAEAVGATDGAPVCDASEVGRSLAGAKAGQFVIANAATDADLDRIVRAALACACPPVLVGSAGFAAALSRIVEIGKADPTDPTGGSETFDLSATSRQKNLGRPVLGLVGSRSAVSREQLCLLEEWARGNGVLFLRQTIGLDSCLDTETAILAPLAAGTSVFIRTPDDSASISPPDRDGGSIAIAETLSSELGTIAARAIHAVPHLALFATGGDTAVAVIREAGLGEILVHREVATGIPLLSVGGETIVPFVTKAGGFGLPDAMIEAFALLSSL